MSASTGSTPGDGISAGAGVPSGGGLLICAPLRCEAWALRGASELASVVRTGFGPRRSAGLDAPVGFDRLAVAGLAGGLGVVASGDVVVADEVSDACGSVALPAAHGLAERLRKAGFPVHCGPIRCVERVVGGARRAELAATGALAVDMESVPMARRAGPRLCAVVRVVLDTSDAPLLDVRTPHRAMRALRRLRHLAPVLAEWATSSNPPRDAQPRAHLESHGNQQPRPPRHFSNCTRTPRDPEESHEDHESRADAAVTAAFRNRKSPERITSRNSPDEPEQDSPHAQNPRQSGRAAADPRASRKFP